MFNVLYTPPTNESHVQAAMLRGYDSTEREAASSVSAVASVTVRTFRTSLL